MGKTALIQGPVSNTEVSKMKPVWGQPDELTFTKKHGYLHNLRLDFLYDPTEYDANQLHNVCIFIVKIVNFAKSENTPVLRPGTPAWNYTNTFLDQVGDIHGSSLRRDIHYTSGTLDDGSVNLNPKYFNVLHKFNLAANHRSINLGSLPGNQTMNWSVNVPCGRMKLEQYGDRSPVGADPVDPQPFTWHDIDAKLIDPLKQVHLLIFSNSAYQSDGPFGQSGKRPYLSVRKTLTYSTSLT